MKAISYDLKRAFTEVSASSAGGAPFLIAYGSTFLITGILSLFIQRPTVALIAMFQGAVALPIAFWLERRMGTARMAPDNPLKDLSMLMAVSLSMLLHPPDRQGDCIYNYCPRCQSSAGRVGRRRSHAFRRFPADLVRKPFGPVRPAQLIFVALYCDNV